MKSASLLRLACAALLVLVAVPVCAQSQEYPVRPIRLIVGFVPGGVADLLTRSLGQKLTEAWGQQVIVDNRAGAGGILAMQIAAKAAPDGYTLLVCSNGPIIITPALRKGALPYDPIRDYKAITSAASVPIVITVQPAHPARSVQDLIRLAKAKQGPVMSYASTGFGTMPHITGELFKRVAGVDLTHVPYKGGNDAMIALLGGHVQVSFGAISTALAHIRSGRLRPLGVSSLKRLAAIPDVPAIAEAGLPGFEVVQWFGVFAPAGMSPAIVRKVNGELVRILRSAEVNDHFSRQGVELLNSTPDEFALRVKAELPKWTRLLTEMNIGDAP